MVDICHGKSYATKMNRDRLAGLVSDLKNSPSNPVTVIQYFNDELQIYCSLIS